MPREPIALLRIEDGGGEGPFVRCTLPLDAPASLPAASLAPRVWGPNALDPIPITDPWIHPDGTCFSFSVRLTDPTPKPPSSSSSPSYASASAPALGAPRLLLVGLPQAPADHPPAALALRRFLAVPAAAHDDLARLADDTRRGLLSDLEACLSLAAERTRTPAAPGEPVSAAAALAHMRLWAAHAGLADFADALAALHAQLGLAPPAAAPTPALRWMGGSGFTDPALERAFQTDRAQRWTADLRPKQVSAASVVFAVNMVHLLCCGSPPLRLALHCSLLIGCYAAVRSARSQARMAAALHALLASAWVVVFPYSVRHRLSHGAAPDCSLATLFADVSLVLFDYIQMFHSLRIRWPWTLVTAAIRLLNVRALHQLFMDASVLPSLRDAHAFLAQAWLFHSPWNVAALGALLGVHLARERAERARFAARRAQGVGGAEMALRAGGESVAKQKVV